MRLLLDTKRVEFRAILSKLSGTFENGLTTGMHRANNLRASGVVCLPSYEMPVEMKS